MIDLIGQLRSIIAHRGLDLHFLLASLRLAIVTSVCVHSLPNWMSWGITLERFEEFASSDGVS
jgi:hypothetical protein